jgi:hypothetical protein
MLATEILDAKYKKIDVVKVVLSSKCTSKSKLGLSAIGKQKDV